jgi:hypothetical protein
MTIETKLEALGLSLPAPLVPPGNFQLVKVHGRAAYVSGHGPFDGATLLVQGLVGRNATQRGGVLIAERAPLTGR